MTHTLLTNDVSEVENRSALGCCPKLYYWEPNRRLAQVITISTYNQQLFLQDYRHHESVKCNIRMYSIKKQLQEGDNNQFSYGFVRWSVSESVIVTTYFATTSTNTQTIHTNHTLRL